MLQDYSVSALLVSKIFQVIVRDHVELFASDVFDPVCFNDLRGAHYRALGALLSDIDDHAVLLAIICVHSADGRIDALGSGDLKALEQSLYDPVVVFLVGRNGYAVGQLLRIQ